MIGQTPAGTVRRMKKARTRDVTTTMIYTHPLTEVTETIANTARRRPRANVIDCRVTIGVAQ